MVEIVVGSKKYEVGGKRSADFNKELAEIESGK